jgi:hypothetical protein
MKQDTKGIDEMRKHVGNKVISRRGNSTTYAHWENRVCIRAGY